MKTYKYPLKSAKNKIKYISERFLKFSQADYDNVSLWLEDIKKRGDRALIKYINKFDSKRVNSKSLKVSKKEFESALRKVDSLFLKTLDKALVQIKSFHLKQKQNSWIDTPRSGVMLGQLVKPLNAAGIYVPGAKSGKTPLISSLLMGVIPAKVAKVPLIAVMTPPMENGEINPYILAAAYKLDIDCVFKAGGAWAIAALAYGTKIVPKVDIIAGPGNIYVTLAKKIISQTTKIDMIAGPSEILIIADKKANPEFIAADLLSQAEHDVMSSSILITNCEKLAKTTIDCLKNQIEKLARKDIAKKAIQDFGAIFLVDDIKTGIELSNQLAPEHLELIVENPFNYLDKIKNTGALFLGPFTPEPIGDYIAGPNHILPTAGTARFSSALSVEHFTKKTSLIHYSKQAFKKEADHVIRLAKIEGLDAHANAIKIRKK